MKSSDQIRFCGSPAVSLVTTPVLTKVNAIRNFEPWRIFRNFELERWKVSNGRQGKIAQWNGCNKKGFKSNFFKITSSQKKLKYGKCMETAKEAKSLDSLVEYRECLETGKTTKFLEYGENLKVLLTDGQTNSVTDIFSQ